MAKKNTKTAAKKPAHNQTKTIAKSSKPTDKKLVDKTVKEVASNSSYEETVSS